MGALGLKMALILLYFFRTIVVLEGYIKTVTGRIEESILTKLFGKIKFESRKEEMIKFRQLNTF
jgi:hypothetical protein